MVAGGERIDELGPLTESLLFRKKRYGSVEPTVTAKTVGAVRD